MNPQKITQQWLAFQKQSFESFRTMFQLAQTQTSDTMDRLLDQAIGVPKENRQAIENWRALMQKEHKRYAAFIDRGFYRTAASLVPALAVCLCLCPLVFDRGVETVAVLERGSISSYFEKVDRRWILVSTSGGAMWGLGDYSRDLYRVDLKSGRTRRWQISKSMFGFSNHSVSPDGDHLASYVYENDGDDRMFVTDLITFSQKLVASYLDIDFFPFNF